MFVLQRIKKYISHILGKILYVYKNKINKTKKICKLKIIYIFIGIFSQSIFDINITEISISLEKIWIVTLSIITRIYAYFSNIIYIEQNVKRFVDSFKPTFLHNVLFQRNVTKSIVSKIFEKSFYRFFV